MKGHPLSYVLVTPARNEEAFIELTLESVVRQTILPLKWVIVSDGSTDRTDEIVKAYSARHAWIDSIRLSEHDARDFAGKVGAFNAGWDRVKPLSYDIIGSLDADISFEPGYLEFLLSKFADDPKLGLAGTPFDEGGEVYDYRFSSQDHVPGACQMFRRECFEAIGGYTPVKGGGIDVIAVLSARVKGWNTHSFPEKTCIHHRPMGSANYHSRLVSSFKLGRRGYCMGYHPLWQIFRSVYQMSRRPYIVGGVALFMGYFWTMIRRVKRPISGDLVRFQQQDQMRRLRLFLRMKVLRLHA